MPAILVTYDLQTPGQKYTKLYEKLKPYPDWPSLMDSTWIVIGNYITPQGVSDDLRTVLDANDLVFCVDITGRPRAGWLQQTSWDWINTYVQDELRGGLSDSAVFAYDVVLDGEGARTRETNSTGQEPVDEVQRELRQMGDLGRRASSRRMTRRPDSTLSRTRPG